MIGDTLRKVLAGGMLAWGLAGFAGWAWEHQRREADRAACDDRVARAGREAVRLYLERWTPADPAPSPTAPAVGTITGRVRPSPRTRPSATGAGTPPLASEVTAPARAFVPAPVDCWIPEPGDLHGGCRVEVVESGGRPWARTWWDAAVRGPDGVDVARRGPELAEDVEVRLPARLSDAVPTLPPTPGWSADLRAGVTGDGDWTAGASWYGRSRWGGWVEARPGSGSAGVALRLGRR